MFSPSPPPLLHSSCHLSYHTIYSSKNWNHTFKYLSLPLEFELLEVRQVGFFFISLLQNAGHGPFIATTHYMVSELTTVEPTQEDL